MRLFFLQNVAAGDIDDEEMKTDMDVSPFTILVLSRIHSNPAEMGVDFDGIGVFSIKN